MEYREEIDAMMKGAPLPGDCGRHELCALACFDVPICVDPSCVYFQMMKTGDPQHRDQGPIVRIAPIANGMEGNLVRAGKRGKPAKRRTQSPLDENARVESAQSRYVGFPNLGNTCYLNVTLQALLSLTEFVSDLTDVHRCLQSNKTPTKLNAAYGLKVFVAIAAAKAHADSPEIINKLVSYFVEDIRALHEDYRELGLQHDPNEFLERLLECWRNVLAAECQAHNVSANLDPLRLHFALKLGSRRVCTRCGDTSEVSIPQRGTLHLGIPTVGEGSAVAERNSTSQDSGQRRKWKLDDLLAKFFANEEVQLNCDNCTSSSAKHQQSLKSLPNVLTFLVKRYANDGVKRNDAVAAPLRLDVLPYIGENSSVANDPADVAYVLRAQILHKGAESQDGHYTCQVFYTDGTGVLYNDNDATDVELSNGNDVTSTESYIYVYVKEEDLSASLSATLSI